MDDAFFRSRQIAVLTVLASSVLQTGCVALNIPSDRLHDPTDGGGWLGHWSRQAAGHHPSSPCRDRSCRAGCCADERHGVAACPHGCQDKAGTIFDPLAADRFDGSSEPPPEPPEVPWPRFHPVPTRPVFGSPSDLQLVVPGQ